MIRKLKSIVSDSKKRDLAMVATGASMLLGGGKLGALAVFGKGLWNMEKRWREENAFEGTWAERMEKSGEFYDSTHQDRVNRILHQVGIPMIVGGTVGMLVSPRFLPPWWVSNALFCAGWGLNFVGHGFFEKNAPAFAEDPLSFIAGPLWDMKQMAGLGAKRRPTNLEADEPVATPEREAVAV